MLMSYDILSTRLYLTEVFIDLISLTHNCKNEFYIKLYILQQVVKKEVLQGKVMLLNKNQRSGVKSLRLRKTQSS